MKKERAKLLKELDEAEDIMMNAMAKRLRLKKQLDFLENKASKAISKELASIEEAEAVEASHPESAPDPVEMDLSPADFGPDVLQMSPAT